MHAGHGVHSSVDSSGSGGSAVQLSPGRACSEGLTLRLGRMDVASGEREVAVGGWCRGMNVSPMSRRVDYTWSREAGGKCSRPAFLKIEQSEVSWLLGLVCAAVAQDASPIPCFYSLCRVVFLVRWHGGGLRYIQLWHTGKEIKKTVILNSNIEISHLPDSEGYFLLISLRTGLGKNRTTVENHTLPSEGLKYIGSLTV